MSAAVQIERVAEVVLFFGIIGGLFVFLDYAAKRRLREQFLPWVGKLGWKTQPSASWRDHPEAEGDYQGRRGRVYSFAEGRGKSRRRYAAIELRTTATASLELQFIRRDWLARKAAWGQSVPLSAGKEVRLGDANFDARWLVRTNRPDVVRAALVHELRARIDALAHPNLRETRLEVGAGRAVYAQQDDFSTVQTRQRAEAALPVLADLVALAEAEAVA